MDFHFMLKRLLYAALMAIAVIVAAVAWNTWRLTSRQLTVTPAAPLALERDAVAARLAGALKFRTISDAASGDVNAEEFERM
jgi:carboxypeptidase PM20D1